MRLVSKKFRVFQGFSPHHISPWGNMGLYSEGWYWEPTDYTGNELWCLPFETAKEAEKGAKSVLGMDAQLVGEHTLNDRCPNSEPKNS